MLTCKFRYITYQPNIFSLLQTRFDRGELGLVE